MLFILSFKLIAITVVAVFLDLMSFWEHGPLANQMTWSDSLCYAPIWPDSPLKATQPEAAEENEQEKGQKGGREEGHDWNEC